MMMMMMVTTMMVMTMTTMKSNHGGFPRFLVAGGPTPDPNDTWAASSSGHASSGLLFFRYAIPVTGISNGMVGVHCAD